MPLTIDAAYTFLGLEGEDRGNLEKLKMRFRKMSLKWHPDKNIHRPVRLALTSPSPSLQSLSLRDVIMNLIST